ncbi:MAG TPA: ATP-binding protein [Vicinamibacterales bacterium]
MPRRQRPEIPDPELQGLLERLSDSGPDGPTLSEQLELLHAARNRAPEVSAVVDRWLVSELEELRYGLADARAYQVELRKLHERLTSPPWYAAVYLMPVEDAADKVLVACGGTQRVVTLAENVKRETLSIGDDVLLNHELNIVLRPLTPRVPRACEVAEFQHTLSDGRLVLKARESEVIARAADGLATGTLVSGDRIRWDPALALAFEKLPRSADSSHFLTETPTESFDDIGGLDEQIEWLQQSVRLHMLYPELVRRYQLKRVGAALLVGPPGTGKTLIARALARWLGEQSRGGRSRFMHIKPSALHSMWYGQSEANYREIFRIAREVGAMDPDIPVIMFFDEIDSIGTTRSDGHGRVGASVLTSLMAELDGLQARGNVLVIAATNRREALDPALLRAGRLGDLVLEIPRPTMNAARAILERHLPNGVPFDGDADRAADTRREVIDSAISRLYAPNGEGEVASIMFRDGTRRAVRASDLVNGAMLANIARAATERACVRELHTKAVGIRCADVLDAIVDGLVNAVASLTPENCHTHVSGLPQDLAVVRVDPVVRKVRRPHQFVRAA